MRTQHPRGYNRFALVELSINYCVYRLFTLCRVSESRLFATGNRVSSYRVLAELLRGDLRSIETANDRIGVKIQTKIQRRETVKLVIRQIANCDASLKIKVDVRRPNLQFVG